MSNLLSFVREKLNEPGVGLEAVKAATGVSVRSLQMLKSGASDNAFTEHVESIAEHFGYQFVPAPLPKRTRADRKAAAKAEAA